MEFYRLGNDFSRAVCCLPSAECDRLFPGGKPYLFQANFFKFGCPVGDRLHRSLLGESFVMAARTFPLGDRCYVATVFGGISKAEGSILIHGVCIDFNI